MQFYAQRALTGEWLDRDVPFQDVEITEALSGPGSLRATITPEYARLLGDDGRPLFEEWGTLLYYEESGQIRWGGVLIRSEFEGPSWTVEAAGFATYPYGIPFMDIIRGTNLRPLDVVRDIWTHVQTQPDGDLGVVVDDLAGPVTLGTEKNDEGKLEPYELVWWESPDCGAEIDTLARETPFDYREEHVWADDTREAVTHRLRLGFPRLGRRQDNLRFVEGENIAEVVAVTRDGDEFANEVVGLGAGEGRKTRRARVPNRDGRLRRVAVLEDKSVRRDGRLKKLARDLLHARQNLWEVTSCVVWEHSHAPLGSFHAGDDILVHAETGWADVALWSRITAVTYRPGSSQIELSLTRSDRYRYGG